jgi:hypothetical protein
MLPKHDLHLKLSKDKRTFTGLLAAWEITVVSRLRRIWIAKIKFLPPLQTEYAEYQSQETYESKLALDALLKAEGLPTRIGILDSTQTYLSFLDIYSIRVMWESPPLSSARRLSMQDILGKPALSPAKQATIQEAPKKVRQTPPLAPVRKPANTKRASAGPITTISRSVESSAVTNAYPLWEPSIVPGPPKGSWYGD